LDQLENAENRLLVVFIDTNATHIDDLTESDALLSIEPGGKLWFCQVKPMQKCLKLAFSPLTSRGQLLWLQK